MGYATGYALTTLPELTKPGQVTVYRYPCLAAPSWGPISALQIPVEKRSASLLL